MKDEIMALLSVLEVGAGNATPAKVLEGKLYPAAARDVARGCRLEGTAPRLRELAREANLAGLPVIAGPCGFYLAESFEEIRAYEQGLISRAMAILKRARALADVEPWSSCAWHVVGGPAPRGP